MRKRKKIHSILVVAGIVCLAGAVFHIVDTGRIFQKQTIIWSEEQKGSYVQAAKKAPVYFADQTFKKRIQQEIDGVADKQKSGKAYYVSPKGNDNAKGSKKKPFRTFKRACKSLKPGDTLYVRGGIYTENIRLGKKQSGTKKNLQLSRGRACDQRKEEKSRTDENYRCIIFTDIRFGVSGCKGAGFLWD